MSPRGLMEVEDSPLRWIIVTPGPIVVIVNPRSGAADQQERRAAELAALFHEAGVEAEMTVLRTDQSPTEAARAAAERASVVVACGGDGTVNGVVAGIIDSPAALGLIPLGTLNHFAKALQIPDVPREAVAAIARNHRTQVDVGIVNGSVFVNNTSIGVYPRIVDVREELRRRGHSKWVAMATAALGVVRRQPRLTVSIEVDGRIRTWRTPIVFVGNNEYDTDGPLLSRRQRLDGGRLVAYLATVPARDLPKLFAKAVLGGVKDADEFESIQAVDLTINVAAAQPIRVAVDGEVTTMTSPLRFSVRPRGLSVIVPAT